MKDNYEALLEKVGDTQFRKRYTKWEKAKYSKWEKVLLATSRVKNSKIEIEE